MLAQACRSLQAQTVAEWECLLVDDCSGHEAAHIASELAATDPRFRLLRVADAEHFPGPWLARNLGVSAAQAELVAFLDADDLWHPTKLEAQLDFHARKNVDMSVTGYYRFEDRDLKVREYRIPPRHISYPLLFLGNTIPLSSVIIRKSSFTSHFQPERHEDYGLWLRIYRNTPPPTYGCIKEALMAYRLHSTSLSSQRKWSVLAVEKLFREQAGSRWISFCTAAIWLLIRSFALVTSLAATKFKAPQKLPTAYTEFIQPSLQIQDACEFVATDAKPSFHDIASFTATGWIQLLREWPPGYGGVERVAHEMASSWHCRGMSCITFSLNANQQRNPDPLPVPYARSCLPHLSFGQLLIPLPHRLLLAILFSSTPLYIHLPCPALLSIGLLARLLRPGRRIDLHWHVFLEREPGPRGWLIAAYQWLALRWAARGVQHVVTTSPVLAAALRAEGVPVERLTVLPCCLGQSAELTATAIWKRRLSMLGEEPSAEFNVLFIGRLNRYKRVDWLIEAFTVSEATSLNIVGDGPWRANLEVLARRSPKARSIHFHGRVTEQFKATLLEGSDLLVLPADQSNEAFGIVQLESMACGVPALALERARSGMAWVSGLGEALGNPPPWPLHGPQDLAKAITLLVVRPDWHRKASVSARQRYEHVFARAIWERQQEALTSIC
ncbi:glycosyltransferase [Synechococcus sp. RedBA-s]|nr:glycosyltransferase [Synechococcus sp. RedBA-s]